MSGDKQSQLKPAEDDDFSVTSLTAPQRRTPNTQHAGHDSPLNVGLDARLGARGRLRRAGVAAGVVLLATLVLLSPALSPALSGALAVVRGRVQATRSPGPLATVATFAVSPHNLAIPPGSAGVGAISVSPAATAPGTAFACWPPRTSTQPAAGALHLAYTTDSGLTWRPIAPPEAAAADNCLAQADTLSASAFLLAVNQATESARCALPALYALRLGGAWRPVPLPSGLSPACSVHVTLAASAVYLWADTPLAPRTADSRGLFVWSPDLGASWHTSPTGLGAYGAFTLLGLHAGGQLLAQATRAAPESGPESGDALLGSGDSGDSWDYLGALPGAQPAVAPLAPNSIQNGSASGDGGWGALYGASAEPVSQPGDPVQSQIWTAASPVGPWQPLPAIPMIHPGSTSGQEAEMLVLGAGPRGGLLVALPVPGSNANGNVPERELWLWDPARRIWLLGTEHVPADAFFDGAAWSQDAPTLWLTVIHLGVPPKVDLYTISVD